MDFKTADLAKIEIFAPGTAGERAIRVEKKDGEVVIIDEKDAASIILVPARKDEVLFSAEKPGEDRDAASEISYFKNGEWKDVNFLAESLDQVIDIALVFLKNENLPCPEKESLVIEYDYPDYYYTYWNSEGEN